MLIVSMTKAEYEDSLQFTARVEGVVVDAAFRQRYANRNGFQSWQDAPVLMLDSKTPPPVCQRGQHRSRALVSLGNQHIQACKAATGKHHKVINEDWNVKPNPDDPHEVHEVSSHFPILFLLH